MVLGNLAREYVTVIGVGGRRGGSKRSGLEGRGRVERVSPAKDSAGGVDVEVDITIGYLEPVEELSDIDVGDASVDIGVGLWGLSGGTLSMGLGDRKKEGKGTLTSSRMNHSSPSSAVRKLVTTRFQSPSNSTAASTSWLTTEKVLCG